MYCTYQLLSKSVSALALLSVHSLLCFYEFIQLYFCSVTEPEAAVLVKTLEKNLTFIFLSCWINKDKNKK